jgi:DNA-binding transcriptional MerR regulator
MTLYSMADVVRETKVAHWKLYYEEYKGNLPMPKRVGRNRVYTEQDLHRIKVHFAKKGAGYENAVRQA